MPVTNPLLFLFLLPFAVFLTAKFSHSDLFSIRTPCPEQIVVRVGPIDVPSTSASDRLRSARLSGLESCTIGAFCRAALGYINSGSSGKCVSPPDLFAEAGDKQSPEGTRKRIWLSDPKNPHFAGRGGHKLEIRFRVCVWACGETHIA